jgi:hypothetical protein
LAQPVRRRSLAKVRRVVATDLDDARGVAVVAKIGSACGGEAVSLDQDVSLTERPKPPSGDSDVWDVMVANAGIGIMCKAIEMSFGD